MEFAVKLAPFSKETYKATPISLNHKKMKKIKVFLYGKPLREIYPHASKWKVFKYRTHQFLLKVFRISIATAFVIGILSGTFVAGRDIAPKTIFAEKEVVKEIDPQYPVLERIAKCESGGVQVAQNGQVIVKGNKNGSVDMGKYQINLSIWGKKATQLGFNLTTEEGNTEMAKWLYRNKGTGAWSNSQNCWQ